MKKAGILILLISILLSCTTMKKEETLNILVFSKTDGYRHESIPTGIATLKELAAENNWNIYATEDSTFFTASNLDSFNIIIFLSTIGNILNKEGEMAIHKFVESGKGLLTIHAGTITEPDWLWYQEAIGAYFVGHPPEQKATVVIEDKTHPSTNFFPKDTWETIDEWYSFDKNPRENVHVLISIDESTYDVDDNGWFEGAVQRMGDHPLVWYKKMGKGIVFQSAFGHTKQMFADTLYRKHLKGAISWICESEK